MSSAGRGALCSRVRCLTPSLRRPAAHFIRAAPRRWISAARRCRPSATSGMPGGDMSCVVTSTNRHRQTGQPILYVREPVPRHSRVAESPEAAGTGSTIRVSPERQLHQRAVAPSVPGFGHLPRRRLIYADPMAESGTAEAIQRGWRDASRPATFTATPARNWVGVAALGRCATAPTIGQKSHQIRTASATGRHHARVSCADMVAGSPGAFGSAPDRRARTQAGMGLFTPARGVAGTWVRSARVCVQLRRRLREAGLLARSASRRGCRRR